MNRGRRAEQTELVKDVLPQGEERRRPEKPFAKQRPVPERYQIEPERKSCRSVEAHRPLNPGQLIRANGDKLIHPARVGVELQQRARSRQIPAEPQPRQVVLAPAQGFPQGRDALGQGAVVELLVQVEPRHPVNPAVAERVQAGRLRRVEGAPRRVCVHPDSPYYQKTADLRLPHAHHGLGATPGSTGTCPLRPAPGMWMCGTFPPPFQLDGLPTSPAPALTPGYCT